MTGRRLVPLVVAAVAVVALAVAALGQVAGDRTATGVVVAVDSVSLTEVRGFTLRDRDGREITFRVGVLENGAEFPPGHLLEHVASAEPVIVSYREEDGAPVAYRLEDAPAPGG